MGYKKKRNHKSQHEILFAQDKTQVSKKIHTAEKSTRTYFIYMQNSTEINKKITQEYAHGTYSPKINKTTHTEQQNPKVNKDIPTKQKSTRKYPTKQHKTH